MFTLRTAKGRPALLVIALLALAVGPCQTETVGEEPAAQAPVDNSQDDAEPEVEADEATAEEIEQAEAMASASAVDYGSCHDYATQGAASDGVFVFSLPGALDGQTVEVDVTLQDGARSETLTGTVEGERVVVLAPLSSFGEEVEVVAIRVNGEELDLSGLGSTTFVVDPASDCENHPEEE